MHWPFTAWKLHSHEKKFDVSGNLYRVVFPVFTADGFFTVCLAGWPQQEMGGELNFGYIFIAAPEDTEVVCPADGIVSHFSVGFHSSLTSSSSYHFDSDNFNAIFDELAAGENMRAFRYRRNICAEI